MATCPNCGNKIPFWNIKAECKNCGVSIPNYNWMERLEEDNKNAEQAFGVFNRTMNRVRYSLFGTKLRIARLVLTFLPIIAFILPWASVKSEGDSFQLALFSFNGSKSALDIISQLFSNGSLIKNDIAFEGTFGPATFLLVGTIFYFLTLLFMVISFFMSIIKCKKPKTRSTITFDVIAIVTAIVSVALFAYAGTAGARCDAFTLGSLTAINVSGGVSLGIISMFVLFGAALGINIAVAVAPAKSDEQLEEERLAKVAAKEEKERQDELKREEARLKAQKEAEEEQKQIIAEAKRKVAEKKAKDAAKAKKRK